MVLRKRLPIDGFAPRLCLLYCPKGPQLDWTVASLRRRVLDELEQLSTKQKSIFLKLDPDVVLATGTPGQPDHNPAALGDAVLAELRQRGWRQSADQIQFKNTITVDLRGAEDQLLSRMKPKTRYNVGLGAKKGVAVRAGTVGDLPALYRLYSETSVRDGFVIREESYYRALWGAFMIGSEPRPPEPFCEPLVAEVGGEVVAAIFVFYFAQRAYYLHGMSGMTHREKMPNHLLQWEAIRRARGRGCTVYDLWGAPDEFDEGDRMWGVFRFKQGLGGQVVQTIGAWDYAPNGMWYLLYSELIPRVLGIMRSSGARRVRDSLGA